MRQYAAFFEWHDRPRKEVGVLEKLIESGCVPWHSPQPYSPDPPDCVCLSDRGGSIAVEIAEVVSQEAAARNAKGEEVMQWWDIGDISAHVRELLGRKDRKSFHGGPYVEVSVCLFTDEPLLIQSEARAELEQTTFGPFTQIMSAYLLFSYVPGQGYPVIPLRINRAT